MNLRPIANLRDDSGLSTVEVIVTIVVGGILLALVAGFSIQGIKVSGRADARNQATAELRTATDLLSRELRTAAVVDSANPAVFVAEQERIAFFARHRSLDLTASDAGSQQERPSVVWLWTEDNGAGGRRLCEQVYESQLVGHDLSCPLDALNGAAPRTCRPVVHALTADADHPTFTYLRAGDTTLNPDGSSVSSITLQDGRVPVGLLPAVQAVEVWLTADIARPDLSDPSTVTRVTLSNLL